MIERITMFRTSDGKIHPSELEARGHEAFQDMKIQIGKLVQSELSLRQEEDVVNFIVGNRAKIMEILTQSGRLA